MKTFKKVIAAASAVTISLANIYSGTQPLIGNIGTVNAETYSDEMQYDDYLSYKKFDEDEDGTYDYVEIAHCDNSAIEVEIPAEIGGLPVTSIGYLAFSGCESLTSIEIPDSVTSIEANAFFGCTGLKSITIPNSVTSIGDSVFSDTPWLEMKQAENPLVIVNSILIDGKTCSGDVEILDGVTSISSNAFMRCKSLTSVTIPDSVTSIGNYAFCYCSGLTSVTIPNGVTSIEYYAFCHCSGLTSITIPDSVTSIGTGAFLGTPWLAEKQVENPLVIVNSILIDGTTCRGDVEIPNSVTSIGDFAFSDCEGLTSIEIPNSVTSIGDWAFSDCESLTRVTIPGSVTSIGDWAFSDCESLTGITIPDSVTSIGDTAFYGCTSLTSITIENPECEISDSNSTINNNYDYDTSSFYYDGVIRGYENSTAQAYAEKYGYKFVSLGAAPFMVSDIVKLKKWLVNSGSLFDEDFTKYDLNEDGTLNVFDMIILRRRILNA